MSKILHILIYPDKRLRELSEPVSLEEIKSGLFQNFLEDLKATLAESRGIGLAAVQVGNLKRVMALDTKEKDLGVEVPEILINPTFVKKEGELVWKEGCLSCPELIVPMKRAAQIAVQGLDREGHEVLLEGKDLLAVVLQHEIDHMDGKLIIDHVSNLKKKIYLDKLKKQQKVVL